MTIWLPYLAIAAWVLVGVVFALDLQYPTGYAVHPLYTGAILLALWVPGRRLAFQVAAVATGLSVAGHFLAPGGRDPAADVFNRGVGVILLWITAAGVTVYLKTAAQRQAEHGHAIDEMKARLEAEAALRQSVKELREQGALAQIGKMAAVVAHEVRNPLAGIRGAVQVIGQRLPPDSRERVVVQEILTRIDTLNEIVQDLLMFARPRQPVISSVPVDTVVQETISLLREDPALGAIAIRVDVDQTKVSADAELLKLVLLNLLINGAQAMRGEGEMRIAARQAGPWHELRIIDQGPGIPPEIRDHLFEPFFTTKHRGTGLGLATARKIAEAHGGAIELECPPGGGTIAVVRLPMSQKPQL